MVTNEKETLHVVRVRSFYWNVQ